MNFLLFRNGCYLYSINFHNYGLMYTHVKNLNSVAVNGVYTFIVDYGYLSGEKKGKC